MLVSVARSSLLDLRTCGRRWNAEVTRLMIGTRAAVLPRTVFLAGLTVGESDLPEKPSPSGDPRRHSDVAAFPCRGSRCRDS